MSNELPKLIEKGIGAAEQGNTLVALVHLEAAAKIQKIPTVLSYLAYCMAHERKQLPKAVSLCRSAMQAEPHNSIHYLNLGRVYLLAGQKPSAIETFRRGLKAGKNPQIIGELKKLGIRRSPVLKNLPRDNPLNKFLGLVFYRLGFR
jgi:tetratricopeptide (TPR) repeat protein